MNRISLRIKLCLKDKTACICYIVSAVVMLCVLLGLEASSEERSAIPIGLVNLDESTEAQNLVKQIHENPSIYVIDGNSREELEERLLSGYINSIFIINEDYGINVRKGATDNLITVISGEDNKVSVIVGDIIAGSMLYDISMSKGYKTYLSEAEKAGIYKDSEKVQWDRDKYREYALSISERPDFSFAFNMEFKDGNNGKIEEKAVTNGMIYRQMIAGMLAMLLSLVAFSACNGICLEHERGIRRRLSNLPGSRAVSLMFDFFGIFVYTLPLGVGAGWALGKLEGIPVSLLYLAVMCLLCLILSDAVKKTDAYQLVGAVLVIGFGVCGFISVFSGLTGGADFLKYTPNALFIESFMKTM